MYPEITVGAGCGPGYLLCFLSPCSDSYPHRTVMVHCGAPAPGPHLLKWTHVPWPKKMYPLVILRKRPFKSVSQGTLPFSCRKANLPPLPSNQTIPVQGQSTSPYPGQRGHVSFVHRTATSSPASHMDL